MRVSLCGGAARLVAAVAAAALVACAAPRADAPDVEITLIAFNDLHGHLEPPGLAITAPSSRGRTVAVPAGGAAYLASAIRQLKAKNPNNAVISAGDMIGASPLVSALFLDEPTVEVANALRVDFNAVGNHEFDKGQAELLRMQHGGCERHTRLQPCRLTGTFAGADFGFLAANTFKADGSTLFAATGMKTFGEGDRQVRVGFIGLTLKNTAAIVTPSGIAGLRFADEAQTANALVPRLKAQGADIIVAIVHEGGATDGGHNDKSCSGLRGAIVPILERLDPSIDVVVSGHTHRAYVCDYASVNPARPFLLTSAGRYGTLLTEIRLRFDPTQRRLVAKSADNLIVQGEPFTASSGAEVALTPLYPRFGKDAAVAALVDRYAAAAAPLAQREVGRLTAPVLRTPARSGESALGNLIADAQLAATRAPATGGAQIAFMNPGGVRADLRGAGGGVVTYGQIFAVQPFANTLVVKRMAGAQLRALLEQQFESGSNTVTRPRVLSPSAGFTYAYDLSAPAGSRISDMRLQGRPIVDAGVYRVAMNSYLAAGGDNFTVFTQGTDVLGGELDVDALEAYLRAHSPLSPPATDRVKRID